ncbi:hypothetical protein GX50_05856 [[Emmonsia] crescens]|uniref:Uncharacterized protein n=1 Tax=[Emmonsia] crescens TaxID=73230 RepID=A0A2B7ZBN7_9EURO|nr:hypothetical protein GX50_05856 [Emmonsia crescens]
MSGKTQETASSTDEKIQYLGSAVLLPGSFPDDPQKYTSSAGSIGEPTATCNGPRDLNGRDPFESIPKRLPSEINQLIQQNKLKNNLQPNHIEFPTLFQGESQIQKKYLNSQLTKMRPTPYHDEEWEEAVEFGDEPALVIARCGEYCGHGRYRVTPWIYCPSDPIPSFELLNLDQLHRLRKKLYLQENGRPLLRAPPNDEFWLIRQQLGIFIRKFQKMVSGVLNPDNLTKWDPIYDLLKSGPSPNPY